jgi:hydroxymethylbilane synthase
LICRLVTLPKLLVGTRNSRLARAQTQAVCEVLMHHNPELEVEYVAVVTEGDTTTTPLYESKNPGVFVSALRDELLAGRVDVIVHSMKDLPAAHHTEIALAAIPPRADPRDVLVSREGLGLSALPPGAMIGTSSPRRAASIRRFRSDLHLDSIRGNVDTRIEKVLRGDFDATVMALAGLTRAGLTEAITEYLTVEDFLPAPRQGALAIECRRGDATSESILRTVEDAHTRHTTEAERALLEGLGAGCSTAVGALATWSSGTLTLSAELAVSDTGEAVHLSSSVTSTLLETNIATELGIALAEEFRSLDIYERASWA